MREQEKTVSTHILIDTMTRGRTIGFSALVDTEERKYTSSARAHTDTKLYVWKGKYLEKKTFPTIWRNHKRAKQASSCTYFCGLNLT